MPRTTWPGSATRASSTPLGTFCSTCATSAARARAAGSRRASTGSGSSPRWNVTARLGERLRSYRGSRHRRAAAPLPMRARPRPARSPSQRDRPEVQRTQRARACAPRGQPLPDPKLEALRDFTRAVVRGRGRVGKPKVRVLRAAGYVRQQILEVILGLALARSLAGAGCNVMLHGFGDADEIETLRAYLEAEHGIRALYSTADMMRPGQIAAMVEEAAEFGGIDILVNNAGIQHVAPIEEFPAEKWNAILAINLSSSFHTVRAALPAMKARGWGRIINIASAHALVASPFKSAYVAAKHGLLGLTKVVALEAAASGVTCNAICPGYVLTPLVERQVADQARARGISEQEVMRDVLLAAQPTKEFVKPEELGALVVFLASDAAASITGTALPVDGGWTAQ